LVDLFVAAEDEMVLVMRGGLRPRGIDTPLPGLVERMPFGCGAEQLFAGFEHCSKVFIGALTQVEASAFASLLVGLHEEPMVVVGCLNRWALEGAQLPLRPSVAIRRTEEREVH